MDVTEKEMPISMVKLLNGINGIIDPKSREQVLSDFKNMDEARRVSLAEKTQVFIESKEFLGLRVAPFYFTLTSSIPSLAQLTPGEQANVLNRIAGIPLMR
jgi:hypothetical protein